MTECILKLDNIHKSFGNQQIHKGVSFQLHKGEAVALLGGSGTGKSTLLRSLIGLEYIESGAIFYKEQRIDDLDEKTYANYRKKISYSFQSGALFDSVTVFENLAFPLLEHTNLKFKEITNKVLDILDLIDLKGKENLMPSDLSGGMQKRVGMARAMILDPDVILYDEPTAGLDPLNTQNVLKIMDKLKARGVASIFVTHDIPAALKVSDRILILKNGVIAYQGTPREIVNTDNPIVKDFFIDMAKKV